MNAMDRLYESLFVNEFSTRYFQAYYYPARSDKQFPPSSSSSSTQPLAQQDVIRVLTHPVVLDFLAPHELLHLYQTCKATWSELSKEQLFVSVLNYGRLSEETVQNVYDKYLGSWAAFLPVLVQLCGRLARIYYPLEPDVAHRAYVMEQACFHNICSTTVPHISAPHVAAVGKLLSYEAWVEGILPHYDEDDDEEDANGENDDEIEYYSDDDDLVPTPTLQELRNSLNQSAGSTGCFDCSTVYWGDSNHPRNPLTRRALESIETNLNWMHENALEAPNKYYQQRLAQRMHPLIEVGQELWSTGFAEFALGIGPNREQYLLRGCTDFRDGPPFRPDVKSFYYCVERHKIPDYPFGKGGFMEFLLGYPSRVLGEIEGGERSPDPRPAISTAIWCYRHALPPLMDPSIDWHALIDDYCGKYEWDSPWEVKEFMKEALTSSRFGSADKDKWLRMITFSSDQEESSRKRSASDTIDESPKAAKSTRPNNR